MMIFLSAFSSSAFINKSNKRKTKFMHKFEQTYKFNTKTEKKATIDQKFLDLFEKVSKK
tara:strand:+ start:2503 stop:2679 length:177 start_codon:yes stop_codon:yes gene_type:complete